MKTFVAFASIFVLFAIFATASDSQDDDVLLFCNNCGYLVLLVIYKDTNSPASTYGFLPNDTQTSVNVTDEYPNGTVKLYAIVGENNNSTAFGTFTVGKFANNGYAVITLSENKKALKVRRADTCQNSQKINF